MTDRRCAGINGTLESHEISRDYEKARQFDRLRVGEMGVFFRDGLRTRFIPFDYMDRVFIRVQETRSRMCCGQTNWYYYRIVFVHDGKEFVNYMSEKEKDMEEALAEIAAKGVATGYIKKEGTN